MVAEFGSVSWPTGIYFGAQTCIFEVGLAYLVARYAVSRGRMGAADAEAYGVALSFWENAILLGAYSLLQISAIYALTTQGCCLSRSTRIWSPPTRLSSIRRASSSSRSSSACWRRLSSFGALLVGLPLCLRSLFPQESVSPDRSPHGSRRRSGPLCADGASLGSPRPSSSCCPSVSSCSRWNVTKRDRAGLSNPPQRGAV